MSYLEIYNEEIRDLLGRDPTARLDLRESVESGVYVEVRRARWCHVGGPVPLTAAPPPSPCQGLTSVVVKGVSEIDHVLKVRLCRAVLAGLALTHSRRSWVGTRRARRIALSPPLT